MSVDLTVPSLGESITEAVVSKWYKKVGDAVSADEPVVSLETDKVTVDVPAPAAGALDAIAHQEGATVKVGQVLGQIADRGGVKIVQAVPTSMKSEVETVTKDASPAQVAGATPVAKKLIEQNQLDAAKITGTGPGGKIQKQDVLTHLDSGTKAPLVHEPKAPSAPPTPRTTGEREERVRMTPLRKRVAERLLTAQSTAAILTTFNEVDMGAVMALRKEHGERFLARHGVKLGFMSFFVRAVIEALKAFPQINAEIDGEDVLFKHYYDIGVAVSGSRGLVVPVVRDADRLSMAELEKQIAEFGVRARADKLTLAELQGGTFTISNGGIFGSMLSTPILNPPQTGILGMHNIVERPVARGGQVVIRPVMYLALSYDHRLVDGREAVQFLVRVKDCIEEPTRLLLEI